MKTLEQVRQEKANTLKQISLLDNKRQELMVLAVELQGQEKLLIENSEVHSEVQE